MNKTNMIPSKLHNIADWEIIISDTGIAGERNKKNPNKINYESNARTCFVNGCGNTYRISRTSGLCDDHECHQHDLLLTLKDTAGIEKKVPSHKDIIDCLMLWAQT